MFPASARDVSDRWLAPADDPNGFIAIPADGTTAVCRVFAPQRKRAALDVGRLSPGREWLNDRVLVVPGPGPILVELQEGWNSLAMRGGPSERNIRWRDFDQPADYAERLALARAAARAAAGQGNVEPPLDDAAKAKLRGQALDWLRAELTARSKVQAPMSLVQTLSAWKNDGDLASIRDAAALARLPAEEREAFSRFWADVAALLEKAVDEE
jgi:hypothetical protein